MKQLLLGVVLLVLLGIAGFFYRNAVEQPGPVMACPLDAKICPDGSTVGRLAPSCEFAACPTVSDSVTYTMPEGYSLDPNAYGPQTELMDAFVKPSLSPGVSHSIIVRGFPIPEGQTADQVILANTRFQPADMQAESFERFEDVTTNGKTYRSVVIERFEALVHSAFYLALPGKVVRFEIIEHDVTDWMEPGLVVSTLPEHAALIKMLGTVQTN